VENGGHRRRTPAQQHVSGLIERKSSDQIVDDGLEVCQTSHAKAGRPSPISTALRVL